MDSNTGHLNSSSKSQKQQVGEFLVDLEGWLEHLKITPPGPDMQCKIEHIQDSVFLFLMSNLGVPAGFLRRGYYDEVLIKK